MAAYGKIKRPVRRLKKYVFNRLDPRTPLHFLHIGKNAGTQIKHVAKQHNAVSGTYRIALHPHAITLDDIPAAHPYFFSIRHPVSRFESGFYSRQRQGQPRHFAKWSPHEEVAFRDFPDANSLAEALFSDGKAGLQAYGAMRGISHLGRNQFSWFNLNGQFLMLRPPVHILRQEVFEEDLRVFLLKINTPEHLRPSKDSTVAHRNNYEDKPALSPLAIRNIERWYAVDLEFYKLCCAWIEDSDIPTPAN